MQNPLVKLFRTKPASASLAKSRLQLILAKERIGISEDQMFRLKKELCVVISKYFEIDQNCLEIEVMTKDGQPELNVNTPVATALHDTAPAVSVK